MIDFRKEPSRRPRRSRTPLALLQPAERVRGSDILEEHDRPLGQVLWESYRNVGDWAVTPREKRTRYTFPLGALERRNQQLAAEWMEPAVRAALEIVRDMMAEPSRTPERLVARACRRISAWAGEQGALATQFYFAAAAGLCVPEDARQAYRVGCLARSLAKWDAAEVWLEHAIAAARRKRDRETQGMAMLGLGNTYYRQGLYPKAREAHAGALVVAHRHGLSELEGAAYHNLFVLEAEDNGSRAEEYARDAFSAYGGARESVLALAHDIAFYWIERGRFGDSLPVLKALVQHFRDAAHKRVHVLGSLVHAAGECGERETAMRASDQIWKLAGDPTAQVGVAPALLEVAKGVAALGEWERAIRAAETAEEIARKRGEMDVVAEAEEALAALKRRRDSEPKTEDVQAVSARSKLNPLAAELVSYLTAGAIPS